MNDEQSSPFVRLMRLALGTLSPPPGSLRIAIALMYGVLCHLIFTLAVLSMIIAMFSGMSRSFGSVPAAWSLLANGMLSKESNETMQKHISRLKQQFSQLSEQDQHLKMQQRHGTTMLIGMRPWEMELFAKLRRYQNIKLYK